MAENSPYDAAKMPKQNGVPRPIGLLSAPALSPTPGRLHVPPHPLRPSIGSRFVRPYRLGLCRCVGSEQRVRYQQPGDLPLVYAPSIAREAETSFSDSAS